MSQVNYSLTTILKLAQNAYKLFESLHSEQKRQILNFASSNFKAQKNRIDFTYKKPPLT
jgi:hypothetical protein